MMLDEVQDKVGEKIAAMTLGLAGVLTGMKSVVILQKGHDVGYSHALLNTGCTIVQIETLDELEKAIDKKTALLWFLHIHSDKGQINHEQWVEVARRRAAAPSAGA